MKHEPALEEGELHSINLRSIREWIQKNKSKIRARPNQTVLYSGRDYDLQFEQKLSPSDKQAFIGTPMYLRLQQIRKRMEKHKVPCKFQTLEDVLESINDYPRIIDRDRIPERFANAHECFSKLEHMKKLLPDARGLSRHAWESLSEIFASNAQGDIRILDGVADDYGKLREDKILLRKELEALLRNDKLSNAGRAVLEKKVSTYGSLFDRRYTRLIAQLRKDRISLKPKPRA